MNFQELQNAVRNISDTVNLGFANLNSTICAQQYETAGLINQMNITNMQNQNALQSLINQCCCDTKSLFAQAEYNRATDTCAITNAIQNVARDIIQNDNANYRQLHDEQIALQMQQKDAQITALTSRLNMCDMQNIASNAVQDAVNQIRPTAGPAWIVPNPNANYGYTWFNNGCCNQNSCCGNNNF